MSSTLKWEPVVDRGKSLSLDVKFLLRDYLGKSIDSFLDSGDIKYIEGLRDASKDPIKKELQKLLDAIEKYKQIRIWEEY